MKLKNSFLLYTFLWLGGTSGQMGKDKTELPFSINYNLPLKINSKEHFDKYDYTEYEAGEDVIQLKHYLNLSKEKAQKIIEDRRFFLLAMFKDQPSPYPGILSNSIGCPIELQPKPIEDTIAVRLYFKLMATSNLIYGNCNITDNYYYLTYALFYCPVKNDFFELKVYTPIKHTSFDSDSLIASIKCAM